ncbi:hypothetical protein CKO42_02895 [Lamprobacter modestohalophilus]|uniref:Glycosyltransferase n=2 Tax=Lamprobacter modestohalophilus TaxID=1064514 RepID=A0A9X0W5X6_9GAMM|nr:hypothetical protein [Lamprobacter modestohalophilus]
MRKGYDSRIIQSSNPWSSELEITKLKKLGLLISGYDVFVFQKVFDSGAVKFAALARSLGVKTVFVQSDFIKTDMTLAVDHVVVVSSYLKDKLDNLYGINCTVIDDAIENIHLENKKHHSGNYLRLIWIGHSDNWKSLSILNSVIEKFSNQNIELITVSNHPDATFAWSNGAAKTAILNSDLAVIPSELDDWAKCKSSNRLTTFMSYGLPVIASPVPSYSDIIIHGKTGFIANLDSEWVEYIKRLQCPELRNKIGSAAKASVSDKFSLSKITEDWIKLFKYL